MKFGHRITGKIETYDDKGRGSFEISNQDNSKSAVAVPFTAIGDEVAATFIKREYHTKVARIETIITPGPDRVAAPCPHAGVCGGCLWQHLDYAAQLKIKLGMINAAFEKAGHEERVMDVMPCERVTPPTSPYSKGRPSDDIPLSVRGTEGVIPLHFRNRMDYVVGWNSEIGLKEYGSWNRYVDLKTCLLLDADVGAILQNVRDWMKETDLQPWDAKFYTGDIRYVVIREGKNTKERMISLIVKDFSRMTEERRKNILDRLSPFCTTLLIGEQSLDTDISQAQKYETLKGNPWLEESVNDVRYRIHPNSFFQTNTGMAGKLQETVERLICRPERSGAQPKDPLENSSYRSLDVARDDKQNILDLYCGLGFFGIYLAKQHPDLHVSGFEIDAEAIGLAKHNAMTNGVAERCDFISGPAENLSWKDIETDTIILDPPRAGLHPKVLKTVLEKKPQTIVYVSCNYHRLVEELKKFKEVYRIEELTALDLFPHTPHVEVVVKLMRRDSAILPA
jgi:tRNA/tmRNA/rRNA uracil-C5-methylase (TrmA/RlmC/RlmD family)